MDFLNRPHFRFHGDEYEAKTLYMQAWRYLQNMKQFVTPMLGIQGPFRRIFDDGTEFLVQCVNGVDMIRIYTPEIEEQHEEALGEKMALVPGFYLVDSTERIEGNLSWRSSYGYPAVCASSSWQGLSAFKPEDEHVPYSRHERTERLSMVIASKNVKASLLPVLSYGDSGNFTVMNEWEQTTEDDTGWIPGPLSYLGYANNNHLSIAGLGQSYGCYRDRFGKYLDDNSLSHDSGPGSLCDEVAAFHEEHEDWEWGRTSGQSEGLYLDEVNECCWVDTRSEDYYLMVPNVMFNFFYLKYTIHKIAYYLDPSNIGCFLCSPLGTYNCGGVIGPEEVETRELGTDQTREIVNKDIEHSWLKPWSHVNIDQDRVAYGVQTEYTRTRSVETRATETLFKFKDEIVNDKPRYIRKTSYDGGYTDDEEVWDTLYVLAKCTNERHAKRDYFGHWFPDDYEGPHYDWYGSGEWFDGDMLPCEDDIQESITDVELNLIANISGIEYLIDVYTYHDEDGVYSDACEFQILHANIFDVFGTPAYMFSYCLRTNERRSVAYIRYAYIMNGKIYPSQKFEPVGLINDAGFEQPYHAVPGATEDGRYACGLCGMFYVESKED